MVNVYDNKSKDRSQKQYTEKFNKKFCFSKYHWNNRLFLLI